MATICGEGLYGHINKQCTICDFGWTNIARTVCNSEKSYCDDGTIGNVNH